MLNESLEYFFEKIQMDLNNLDTQWHWNTPGHPILAKFKRWGPLKIWNPLNIIYIEFLGQKYSSSRSSQFCFVGSKRVSIPGHFSLWQMFPKKMTFYPYPISWYQDHFIPERDLTDEKMPAGNRRQLVSQIAQSFWNRWKDEYLPTLRSRKKWLFEKRSFQINNNCLRSR